MRQRCRIYFTMLEVYAYVYVYAAAYDAFREPAAFAFAVIALRCLMSPSPCV